jgi:hypothetical protein
MYIYEQIDEIDFVYHLDSEIGIVIQVIEIDEYHGIDGEIIQIHIVNDGMQVV